MAVQSNVGLQAKLFRGLADLSRLAILEALRDGPRNVSEVVEATELSQPNASMHLECLRCCGLVERERKGRYVYYRIRSRKLHQLLAAAGRVLVEAAEQIASCARYRD